MPALVGQIRAIAMTDLALRLRRPATLWLVVVLSGLAYAFIPSPATGRGLMVADGARALYTSQVMAITTAGLAAILLTFAGFYLTSNGLRRDLLSRTGGVIAASPVGSGCYVVGKWLGGSAYLALVTGAYLLNVMAMHLLRGEGPLQPFTYLLTYLLVLGPAILVVAALALCFECIPPLSGRGGDVVYLFVWGVLVAIGAIGEGRGVGQFMDVMGIGFILGQVHSVTAAQNLAIGMTPFDPQVAPWVLSPLSPTLTTLLPRVTTALFAVPILLIARVFFHRFDPTQVRNASQSTGGHLIRRTSLLVKPLIRLISGVSARLVRAVPVVLRPVLAETVMTFCQSPLVLVAWVGILATTVFSTQATVVHTLPIALAAVLAVALADLSTRDWAAGTQAMLFSMPGVRSNYALIKLCAAALLALLFCLPPALRIAIGSPERALSLLISAGFMAALATALGLLTRTPKTFMGVFLLFLYLVLGGAQLPALDFAGWNGVATGSTRMGYLVVTILLAALAEGKHRWDLAREE